MCVFRRRIDQEKEMRRVKLRREKKFVFFLAHVFILVRLLRHGDRRIMRVHQNAGVQSIRLLRASERPSRRDLDGRTNRHRLK